MLNLGPNPRFWAQIGPKITHFNKYRCNKAGKSSIYGNNECLSYNDSCDIFKCNQHLSDANPHFGPKLGLN